MLSAAPSTAMTGREQIEGELIALTAQLHELALRGIGESNMHRVRGLTVAVNAAVARADRLRPRLVVPEASRAAGR